MKNLYKSILAQKNSPIKRVAGNGKINSNLFFKKTLDKFNFICYNNIMKRKNSLFYKGFSLIELLVVVLIVGILAAVAFPQYQLAVQKAELANYRTLSNAVAQAAVTFHLATGAWPQQMEDLDIAFPQLGQANASHGGCVYNDTMYCCLTRPIPRGSSGTITCGKKDYSFAYVTSFASSTGESIHLNRCFSTGDLKVCQASGGTINNRDAALLTPNGVVSPRYEYVYRGE